MKLKFKYGFTMAELLVCLAIISVIATILIPTLGQIRPDKEMTMFKKAYSVTERVVEELVNDPELYPDNDINIGFDNIGEVSYNGETYGNGNITFDDTSEQSIKSQCDANNLPEGQTLEQCQEQKVTEARDAVNARIKFCTLFGMKVNTIEDRATIFQNCINAHGATQAVDQWSANTNNVFGGTRNNPQTEDVANSDNKDTFTTTDGIIWRMPYTNFVNNNNEGGVATIWIDVNGHRKPNIADEEFNPDANPTQTCDRSLNVDRFSITVRADGKMSVNGVCAREYISEMSLMRGRGN